MAAKGKFHINKDGQVRPCTAQDGNCKYGLAVNEHFETVEEAQQFHDTVYLSNKKTVKKIGYSTLETAMKDRNSLTHKVFNRSVAQGRGFDNEVFMSATYARSEMGLNNALVFNGENWSFADKLGPEWTKEERVALLKTANRTIKKLYPTADLKKTVRAIYFSSDKKNKGMYLQTGASNTLDSIAVNGDSVHIIEIKKTHKGGAQLAQRSIGVTHNGSFNFYDETLHPEIANQIAQHNIYDTDKDQIDIKVRNDIALAQFVEDYKQKGCNEFICSTREGYPITVDMNRNTEAIVQELMNHEFQATVKIRTNQTTSVLDRPAITRLQNTVPVNEIGDINFDDFDKSKMKQTGKYVRIGEFKLPIKWEDRMKKGQTINLKDVKFFSPVLSGDLKHWSKY